MTKRLTVALLCAVAAFALGGVATAQAKGLSYADAKVLAKRLAERQVRGRNVVSFHLQRATREGPSRLVFPYDDRTADHVFCTARVIVTARTSGRTTTTTARFAGVRCAGIPSEVLRFEALTRHTQRDLRTNTAATVDALDAVKRSSARCRHLTVPRSKADEAQALFDIALVQALEGPNDAAVGSFVASLLDANASDPTLAAGAAAWADYLATVRALPDVPDPCGDLKSWKRAGFAASAAPIDFPAYRSLDRRAARDTRAIERAAALMLSRGAFPNASIGFTPDGLLLQLAAKAGITGGPKAKLVLGS
ncbi:MAG: hypothetical protein QOJ57_2815 [Thermoleophilaceae bacterium]|jgi:hypothetical protein|nr:hypothetical protein [Thermoleophilaceae bacterium]